MTAEPVANYRVSFYALLTPIMDLLDHKRQNLPHGAWLKFVDSTRQSIVSSPEQFLGRDLPENDVIREVVDEIFGEYLRSSVPAK